MSKRRPATPKEPKDTIVVAQSNGSSASKVHPASALTPDSTEAKLLAYVHDERHFSFVRYLTPSLI
jgi:hypothetical protein